MSPVMSREERDAIRTRATSATRGDDPSYYAGTFIADTFALLDALDAAEGENERLRAAFTNSRAIAADRIEDRDRIARDVMAERDAALAEVAALRGRIEALAAPTSSVLPENDPLRLLTPEQRERFAASLIDRTAAHARCPRCGRFARQVSVGADEGSNETATLTCTIHGRWTEGY